MIFFFGGRSQDSLGGKGIMSRLLDSSTVLFDGLHYCNGPAGLRGRLAEDVDDRRPGHLLPAPRMKRAAGESFIGSENLRMPSYLHNAPATAGAVGTSPISPTPFAP